MRWALAFLVFASCGSSAPPPVATAKPPAPPAPAAPTAAASAAPAAPDSSPTVLTAAERARDAEMEQKVTPIVDAFGNRWPRLLRDGHVVFISTRDGLPAVYLGDAREPSAKPKKLPGPDQRITIFEVMPDEKSILFLSDVHGDGNFRIFRVALAGGDAQDLTPGESMHRDFPHVARRVPGLFAYSAHVATDRTAHVYLQRADGSPPREVYHDTFSGNVQDVSPDGRRLLYERFISHSDAVVFELDVATGKLARLYPPEGEHVQINSVDYAADGRRVLVAAADEGHPSWLVALDKGKPGTRYEETENPTATIGGTTVSPAGDRLAITIDAGNHSLIRILDAKTLRPLANVESGLGIALASGFRADGKSLGVNFSNPGTPQEIFAADARTGAVTRLRDDPRPGLSGTPVESTIVPLHAHDGLTIPVNLYLPEGARGPLPTVIHIHGGPSSSAAVGFNAEVRMLIDAGFAVVQPNIRGSTGFGLGYEKADDREKRGDALKDVETVNAWARAQPWCNGKLAIMGTSYGGYMTLLALTRQPGLWQAGVDGSGMSDLKTMEALEDQTIRAYDETEFGALGKDDAVLEEWSPIKDMARIQAPVFIYQGVHDPITPQEQADRMVAALRARKVPVEYLLIDNEGHGVVRRENRIVYYARVVRFLHDRLR